MKCKKWSDQENSYLIENYAAGNISEISKHLNRTEYAIQRQANYVLGLKRELKHQPANPWQDHEIITISELYGKVTIDKMAKMLNRSHAGVTKKLVALGIHQEVRKKSSKRKTFVDALEPSQVNRMVLFLAMLRNAKAVADKMNIKANIDLSQMVDAYRVAVG